MSIVKIAGSITAVAAAAAVIWGVLDYTGLRPVVAQEVVELQQEVAANSLDRYYRRYQALDRKRMHQGLTVQEKSEFCFLAVRLGWTGPGCR